jgi:hypothetical protein
MSLEFINSGNNNGVFFVSAPIGRETASTKNPLNGTKKSQNVKGNCCLSNNLFKMKFMEF